MPYKDIRNIIDDAIQHEAETGAFRQILEHNLQHLHPSIQTTSKDVVNSLQFFVIDYMRHVPDCLEVVEQDATELGLEEAMQPFVNVAIDYFLSPPAQIKQRQGLAGLLHTAYLAHRMLEELNDNYLSRTGQPLIPRNLVTANLVVHELIGSELASELEQLISQMTSILSARFNKIPSSLLKQSTDAPVFERWPCFGDPHGVQLRWGRLSATQ
ncbi:hypothetical protein [Salinibius halmophilus]|uniref:hypothetical protein n=1 Tax=Salinibius halmophilus TaxID=1853216 RepID=UPI000E67336B|nr:hypothetical protein [Salinibius halmophilus]